MAPKPPRIPQHEWDRHKDAVKALYAQHTLTEVIERMREEHGFSARSAFLLQMVVLSFIDNMYSASLSMRLNSSHGVSGRI